MGLQPNRFSVQAYWHIWAEPRAPAARVMLRRLGAGLRVPAPGLGWVDTNLFPFSESSLDLMMQGRGLKGKKVVNQGLAVASYSLCRKDLILLSDSWKGLWKHKAFNTEYDGPPDLGLQKNFFFCCYIDILASLMVMTESFRKWGICYLM